MIILVSDTSILIDLERGGLLEAAFSCGLTMVVPDLLSCAARTDHALVTGDRNLRTEAMARLGTVYGLLWLLDKMADSGHVTAAQLFEGLQRISTHPRCRLPATEVRSRLRGWDPSHS